MRMLLLSKWRRTEALSILLTFLSEWVFSSLLRYPLWKIRKCQMNTCLAIRQEATSLAYPFCQRCGWRQQRCLGGFSIKLVHCNERAHTWNISDSCRQEKKSMDHWKMKVYMFWEIESSDKDLVLQITRRTSFSWWSAAWRKRALRKETTWKQLEWMDLEWSQCFPHLILWPYVPWRHIMTHYMTIFSPVMSIIVI
jgi:hypothetical protein